MPLWVKLAGLISLALALVAFALATVAMRPPVDEGLVRLAVYLGLAALISAYIFLRAVWTWERLKFRARAWWTGRQEARSSYRARRPRA